MSDTDWIALLKPGDKVIIERGYGGRLNNCIRTIDKITPTGRIKICSEYFDSRGYEIGEKSAWTPRDNLAQWSQEIEDIMIENAEKIKLASRLNNFVGFSLLPIQALRDITEIVNKYSKPPESAQ